MHENGKFCVFQIFMRRPFIQMLCFQKEYTKKWGVTAACTLHFAELSSMSGQHAPSDGKNERFSAAIVGSPTIALSNACLYMDSTILDK